MSKKLNKQEQEKLDRQLFTAIDLNNVSQARALIEQGANTNAYDPGYQNPLYFAAHRGQYEMVSLLLEKSAEVNTMANPHERGQTALHAAAEHNDTQIASLLINYGADANAKAIGGITPVEIARSKGWDKMVALLTDPYARFQTDVIDTGRSSPKRFTSVIETSLVAPKGGIIER